MREEKWLACVEPVEMLEFLGRRPSERKVRLFACACLRRARGLLTPQYLKAVGISERNADDEVEIEELAGVQAEVNRLASRSFRRYRASPWSLCVQRQFARQMVLLVIAGPLDVLLAATHDCWVAARSRTDAETKWRKEQQARCALLRDLFGNPFHPITISSAWLSWNDAIVIRLAQTAYDNRILPAGTLDNARLAVLADALEEAGCTDGQILGHLRGGGEHYRGCWAIDLLLGKE